MHRCVRGKWAGPSFSEALERLPALAMDRPDQSLFIMKLKIIRHYGILHCELVYLLLGFVARTLSERIFETHTCTSMLSICAYLLAVLFCL